MTTKPVTLAVLGILAMAGSFLPGGARAQTFQTLYAFQGGSAGYSPQAPVLRDKDGNLYGTTAYGGSLTCEHGDGCGTAYRLSPDGTETVLYAFSKSKGTFPTMGLVADKKGNFYGTTERGGKGGNCFASGCGVIFEITSHGKEKTAHLFQGGDDGRLPSSGLVADTAGNFYGVTAEGGGNTCKSAGKRGCGMVFKFVPGGSETLLYSFKGGTDGEGPGGNLTIDAAGNLYGITGGGGANGYGTVFMLAPDGTETVLHAFGGKDGAGPTGGLVLDSSGNLYGTTNAGGGGPSCFYQEGCGTVFKLAPDGTETVLYSFCSQPDCTDGAEPTSGPILDKSGNLYGTTIYGGSGCNEPGCGNVYELAPDGTETVLHAFDSADGAAPEAALIMDKLGTLYGTTGGGGANNLGTVFSIVQ